MIHNQVGMMIALTEKHCDESTRVTDRLIHFSSVYLLNNSRLDICVWCPVHREEMIKSRLVQLLRCHVDVVASQIQI